jgi:hypothetical protein
MSIFCPIMSNIDPSFLLAKKTVTDNGDNVTIKPERGHSPASNTNALISMNASRLATCPHATEAGFRKKRSRAMARSTPHATAISQSIKGGHQHTGSFRGARYFGDRE